MKFCFFSLICPLLFSTGKAANKITLIKPELPEVVVIRGEGTIVNPDEWTPFPTLQPVVTTSPTAYPTLASPPPTTNPYHLWFKGSHSKCILDTAVLKDNCLEAALLVGNEWNFPYHLTIIESATAPCGCSLRFKDNGDPVVEYNTHTLESGGCAQKYHTRLICEKPPPTMAPSPGVDCLTIDEFYYAAEGTSYCYRVRTGLQRSALIQRPYGSDCYAKFQESSEQWVVGYSSNGDPNYTDGEMCNNRPREGSLTIIEEDRSDTVGTAVSYSSEAGVCTYDVTIRRPPCF